MADEQNDVENPSVERPAFGALLALFVAPLIAQGLWRPLVHFFGFAGSASAVTATALLIGAVVALVQALRPDRTPLLSLGLGFLIAVAATVGWSLGLAGLLTLLVTATALAFLVRWLFPRLPAALDGLAKRHRVLTGIYVVMALFTVVSLARVSIFMGDSRRVDLQALPGEKFLETHSCLTAYVHADALSRQHVANLYETQWWNGAHGMPTRTAGVENPYQPFLLDYYAYPPPFLLAMWPLAPLAGDFAAQRALWFGLNGLLFAVGLWVMARWLDGPSSHRVLLLAPIFFGSLPVLATLQTGNFQVAVVTLAVLSMVAFHRDRHALGGALLAFAILSKISPGVLGIVLLAQRRFRSAAWTAGFGVLFLALSVMTLGIQPLKAFLTYTLGRLSSGEAFSFMDDNAFSILTNMSPFGLPFKLQLLGVNVGDPWVVGRWIGRIYSAALVVVALLSARRQGDRRSQALSWMSLLVLAALQSPFGPAYTLIGLMWAITLLTVEVQRLREGLGLVLLWLGLVIVPPVSMSAHAIQSMLQSALAVGVPVFLILRAAQKPESSARAITAANAAP